MVEKKNKAGKKAKKAQKDETPPVLKEASSNDAGDVPVENPAEVAEKRTIEEVEYRDQDGNLLDAEQVKSLEGKVEFQTKYETRTRVVDEAGNELEKPDEEGAEVFSSVAPPHPDVEGVDKETLRSKRGTDDEGMQKEAAVSRDGEKEAGKAKPKPASESKEATVRDEL